MIWLARSFMWRNAGFPVAGRFPTEGSILYVSGMVLPKNAPDKEAAYRYMNALLEPSAQQGFAAHMGYLPTVDNAPLSGSSRRAAGLPASRGRSWCTPDYPVLSQGASRTQRLVAEEHPARIGDGRGPRTPSERAERVERLCSGPPAC